MKNIIYKISVLVIITLMQYCPVNGQNQKQAVTNIATFTKVWGFLKYYHPTVGQGKINWDSVFVNTIPLVIHQPNEQFNSILNKLLQYLGSVEKCFTCQPIGDIPDSWKRNLNLGWLYNDTLLSVDIKSKLQYIRENRHQGESHYVKYIRETKDGHIQFINETDYADSLLIEKYTYRLLGLARHWNAAEYFFAYKYLLSRDWNKVLWEYIPQLLDTMNLEQYHLTIIKLTRELEDGHAVMGNSRYLLTNKWSKIAPFTVAYIKGKTIVSDIRYHQLNKVNDIQLGDVILKVDNVPDKELRKQLYPFFKGSNESLTQGTMNNLLFAGNTDKVIVELQRNGKVKKTEITRYPFKAFWDYTFEPKPVLTLKEHCAIINLGVLREEQVDSVMKPALNKKAIIFDLRNYLQVMFNHYMYYLSDEFKIGYKGYNPMLDYVGVFEWEKQEYGKLENGNLYEGLKIVLVNEFTQSAAEFTAMYFQSLPNTIVIGSQTAGTDGNVTSIILPGNINAIFSNVIIEYPDGTQCQKSGIKLDYKVTPTEQDIKSGRDAILDFAVTFSQKHIQNTSNTKLLRH